MYKNIIYFIIILTLLIPNITIAQRGGLTLDTSEEVGKIALTSILAGSATCLTFMGVNYIQNLLSEEASDALSEFGDAAKEAAFNFDVGAAVGAELGGPQPVIVTNEVSTKSDKSNALMLSKEACWDGIAKGVANNVLQAFSKQILSLANKGFDGNPVYVRDINELMQSISMQKLNILMPQVETRNPVFGNALRSILTDQIKLRGDSAMLFINNTEEGRAYNDFMEDFTKGGWGAFLNNMNNPLSAIFDASNRVFSDIANEKNNIRGEISRGNGFLDIKECTEYDKEDPNLCVRYVTLTPGNILSEQVSLILGSPIRQTELVDEIDEVILMYFAQLIDKLFSKDEGLFGMGALQGDFGGTNWGSNITFKDGSPIRPDVVLNAPSGFSNVDISRPQYVREVITAQHMFLNRAKDHLYANFDELYELGRLDYCMPGPNPMWANTNQTGSLQENVQNMISQEGINADFSYFITNPLLARPLNLITTQGMPHISFQEYMNTYAFGYLGFDKINSLYEYRDPYKHTVGLISPFNGSAPYSSDSVKINLRTGIQNLFAQKQIRLILPSEKFDWGDAQSTNILRPKTPPIYYFPDKVWLPFMIQDKKIFTGNMYNFIYRDILINTLSKELLEMFGNTKIINAFKEHNPSASPVDKTLTEGMATVAYEETKRLLKRSVDIFSIEEQFTRTPAESGRHGEFSQAEQNLIVLNQIYTDVQNIVEPAKARYIAERAAAGDPVNMQCIDAAYVIDRSPINIPLDPDATPRDLTLSPAYNTLKQNRIYFESIL